MSNAWERLRTWLWWLEPRPQIRGGLRYGYERNWHRSRKWRADFVEQIGVPTSFAELKITRPPESHPVLDRPTHYPDLPPLRCGDGSGYICPGHAGYNAWFCDGEPE